MGLKNIFNKQIPQNHFTLKFNSVEESREFAVQYQRMIADGTPIKLPIGTTMTTKRTVGDTVFPEKPIVISDGMMYPHPQEYTKKISSPNGDFDQKVLITLLQSHSIMEFSINDFFMVKFDYYPDSFKLDFNVQRIDKRDFPLTEVCCAYRKVLAIIHGFELTTAEEKNDIYEMVRAFTEVSNLLEKAIEVEKVLGVSFQFSKVDWEEDWIQIAELYASLVEKRIFRRSNLTLTTFTFTKAETATKELSKGAIFSMQSFGDMSTTVMGVDIALKYMMAFVDVTIKDISIDAGSSKYNITPDNDSDTPNSYACQFYIDDVVEDSIRTKFAKDPSAVFEKCRTGPTIKDLYAEYFTADRSQSLESE